MHPIIGANRAPYPPRPHLWVAHGEPYKQSNQRRPDITPAGGKKSATPHTTKRKRGKALFLWELASEVMRWGSAEGLCASIIRLYIHLFGGASPTPTDRQANKANEQTAEIQTKRFRYMNKIRSLIAPLRRVSLARLNASVILFVAAIAAVILANSPLSAWYYDLLKYPIEVKILGWELFTHHGQTMTLYEFVNDYLMAIFFFIVGLEIKQEMTVGELSTVKKSMLPIIAALGGMVVPVLLFFSVVHEGPGAMGAAVPMATDIAFALALISALGKRVPATLRIFLMALAVVDDIGGIIIIALFYSSGIVWTPLMIAGAVLLGVVLLGRAGVEHPLFYLMAFFLVWQLFLISGLHATIAGVVVALCIPITSRVRIDRLRAMLRRQFDSLPLSEQRERRGASVLSHGQMHITDKLKRTLGRVVSPVQALEHGLAPIVSFIILPLFAFANAGVSFEGLSADGLFGVPLAILLGLFPGKAIGITLFTWAAITLGICTWPAGMNLRRLIPLSIFGGIGFTVSLFIASLAYGTAYPELLNQAKVGIFAGTILSGVVGYLWLGKVIGKGDELNCGEADHQPH